MRYIFHNKPFCTQTKRKNRALFRKLLKKSYSTCIRLSTPANLAGRTSKATYIFESTIVKVYSAYVLVTHGWASLNKIALKAITKTKKNKKNNGLQRFRSQFF